MRSLGSSTLEVVALCLVFLLEHEVVKALTLGQAHTDLEEVPPTAEGRKAKVLEGLGES